MEEGHNVRASREFYKALKESNPKVPTIYTIRAMGNIFIESKDGKISATVPDENSLWNAKAQGIVMYLEMLTKKENSHE